MSDATEEAEVENPFDDEIDGEIVWY
jgi:hypothetical protein